MTSFKSWLKLTFENIFVFFCSDCFALLLWASEDRLLGVWSMSCLSSNDTLLMDEPFSPSKIETVAFLTTFHTLHWNLFSNIHVSCGAHFSIYLSQINKWHNFSYNLVFAVFGVYSGSTRVLFRFYLGSSQVLLGFYSGSTWVLLGFYPGSIWVLARFYLVLVFKTLFFVGPTIYRFFMVLQGPIKCNTTIIHQIVILLLALFEQKFID